MDENVSTNTQTVEKESAETNQAADSATATENKPAGTVEAQDAGPTAGDKAWDTTSGIRDGWQELTNAAGRFLVGCESGETWDDPGDTGGVDLNHLPHADGRSLG